jgi:carbonic anhydrase
MCRNVRRCVLWAGLAGFVFALPAVASEEPKPTPVKPDAKAEAKGEVKPKPRSWSRNARTKTDTKSEGKSEGKTESKPNTKDTKSKAKASSKSKPASAHPEPKPEPKPEPNPEANNAEPKADHAEVQLAEAHSTDVQATDAQTTGPKSSDSNSSDGHSESTEPVNKPQHANAQDESKPDDAKADHNEPNPAADAPAQPAATHEPATTHSEPAAQAPSTPAPEGDHAAKAYTEHAPAEPVPAVQNAHAEARADAHAEAKPEPARRTRTIQLTLDDDKIVDATVSTTAAHEAPATPANDVSVDAESLTPAQVLTLLKEGNQRWVNNQTQNPATSSTRREETAQGQKPFAAILTCADSRLPVERVFDRGVGELFVTRVAGNIAGEGEAGTVEYGLTHLNAKLLVVMGHTKCGAVTAACSDAPVHGKVGSIINAIKPAVERAARNNPEATGDALVQAAIKENIWETVYDLLAASPQVRELVDEGKVQVVGALYDITTGKVEFLGEHPWQRELLTAMNLNANQPAGAVQTASEPSGH